MRVSLFQQNIVVGDAEANLRNIANALAAHGRGSGLFVLPELCTTGWGSFDLMPDTVGQLRQLAVRHGITLVGSVLGKDDDGMLLNNAFAAFPDGNVMIEPKRHLFSYGGEDERFSRGSHRLEFELSGVKICVLVCYDLRFPAWSRNRVINEIADYDLLVYVAEFPAKRIQHWDRLLPARAVENQCFVAAVNCADGGRYCGHSVLLDYNGEALTTAGETPDAIIAADIDLSALVEYRKRYPFLADADNYSCL